MTNSKSRASTSSLALLVLLLVAGTAEAGRKRVVVLDFDGPKAEKFHDDMVKLVKKSYTVVPTDKWNGTAEELEATAQTDKDIKKVARKLKVDAIISGKIEKRRDEYLIHLKLHPSSGGDSKSVDTKSSGPRIDGKASSDIKDELLDAIDSMEGKGGGDGDDEPKTKKKVKKDDDSGDDEPKTKKKVKKDDDAGDDDGDKPKHKGFSKHDDDMTGGDKVKKKDKKKDDDAGDDDGDKPKKKIVKKDDDDGDKPKKKDKVVKKDDDDGDKPKKKDVKKKDDDDAGGGDDGDKPKKKEVAKKDDDDTDTGGGVEKEVPAPAGMVDPGFALSPGGRSVDANAGISATARRMSFKSDPTIANPPPGYKGVPVAGGYVDATIYPGAISHKKNGMLSNIGLVFTFDRALIISSKKTFQDDTGTTQTAKLDTAAQRFSVGAAFRYPLGTTATAPVVGAQLRFGQQSFLIAQTIPGTNMSSDIPNVTYTQIIPSANVHFPVNDKITLNANVGLELITSTGGIGTADQYGAASVLGIDGDVGGDYMATSNVFVRAAFHADTIGLTFKGTGTQTLRGTMAPVVSGARDTYLGGIVTVGYVY